MNDTSDISPAAAHRESGQAAVEFALVMPILALILFGIVQFGMAFWNYQQISAAASEGARRASISRTYADRETRVCNAVVAAAPQLNMTCSNVNTNSTWAAGSQVTVTVRRPQRIEILGIVFFNNDLVGRRTFRVEQ